MATLLRSNFQFVQNHLFARGNRILEKFPGSSISPSWRCVENVDGSLTLFNDITGKRISISPQCLQNGCNSKPQINSIIYHESTFKVQSHKPSHTTNQNDQDWGMLI